MSDWLKQSRPRIAVVGIGAVGGFYGARLIRAGHDVHLLARSDYDALRENGLHVRSYEGDFQLPAGSFAVYRDPADLPPVDLVIVTLKATGNDAYAKLLSPIVRPGTTVLTLQNGLGNEDELARLFGADHVLGGMAFVCIHRIAPGVVHHIDHGFLKIGEYQAPGMPGRGVSPRMERIAELFREAGIRVDPLTDLRTGRWEKLVWNIPFNGLGAVLDHSTDMLVGNETGLSLVRRIMGEVVAAATADGARLAPDIIDRQLTHTQTMGAYQSSMQVDRRAGRPLEVEAILGEPARRARQLGVATPTLEILYEMARLTDRAIRQTGGTAA